MNKHWIAQATAWLKASREPVPHEVNELDWKGGLSGNSERLIEHLIAFANHTNGGCLVFGITEPDAELVGVTKDHVVEIAGKLTNLGRDAIEPPSQTLTNTTLRLRFKVSEKQRNQITNLIADAVTAGRIKRKDTSSGNKFAEYWPYWA